jgi:hypothetical protein
VFEQEWPLVTATFSAPSSFYKGTPQKNTLLIQTV